MGSDEEDPDAQGVGLSTGSNTRFVSDSLHFTGIDLGDRARGASRRRYIRGSEEDDEDEDEDSHDDSSSDDDDYEEELAQLPPAEREEALLQMAMQRVERARIKGKTDVNLSKAELGAFQRHQKRLEREEERRRRASERKKRKEQRIAVPLTHLEPSSRKKKAIQPPPVSLQPRQDSLPRQISAGSQYSDVPDRQAYPPMGYFPPPAGTRVRPRSGTTTSQRPPSRAREDQRPVPYEHLQQLSAPGSRQPSDTVPLPRSSTGPLEEPWIPNVSPNASPRGRSSLDPFQFQIGGPRAAAPPGAGRPSRRHASGPSEMAYIPRRPVGAPSPARSRQVSQQAEDEDTSEDESEEEEEEEEDDEEEEDEEEEEESSSDDPAAGAQIRQPPRLRQPEVIVIEDPEPEPEPEPEPVRRAPAPARRKQPSRKQRRR